MKVAYNKCSINVSHDDDNGVGVEKGDNSEKNLSFVMFVGLLLTSLEKVPLYTYRSWDRRLIVEAFIGDRQFFSRYLLLTRNIMFNHQRSYHSKMSYNCGW